MKHVAVIIDSSVLIDFVAGRATPTMDDAVTQGTLVLPPLAVAEVLSGETTPEQRETVGNLLQDSPLHDTPLAHWMAVGELRRMLRARGINATIPDAHIAQCALDRGGTLLTRDEIFARIAEHTTLRILR